LTAANREGLAEHVAANRHGFSPAVAGVGRTGARFV
jgi:hypothetical protein